ncbi:hypothetical protein [Flavobacterium sp. SOK18b]|uniref:hypothetical protein n=1 Tax=Flavobacterium sp. SOK18b TaxID=797900 RepID=UPI001C724B89|nr:hypothetical protein [Flavobacterium sp. SOK18b]
MQRHIASWKFQNKKATILLVAFLFLLVLFDFDCGYGMQFRAIIRRDISARSGTECNSALSYVETYPRDRALLERQAYVADKKAILFDMMIDLAEKEYHIDIRKNSAPEQSPALEQKNKKQ